MFERLENMLYKVEKPGRYIGGEINSVKKNKEDVDVSFAFAFPDVYEVGMSHLGMHIIYNLINKEKGLSCERVFTPWPDMEDLMRREGYPLFTMESKSPVKDLDILGFTLQYELSYTNILNMLDLSGIPLLHSDRNSDEHPIIIAGGPCSYNPEPLCDIVDLFVIGEGEEVNLELLNLYRSMKSGGKRPERDAFLKEACKIRGIYVPSLYETFYNADGTIQSFGPVFEGAPERIVKRIVENLDEGFYPDRFIIPNIDAVHDRAMIEIFRGCTKGCRFCQAGMIYRPLRERSTEKIMEITDTILRNTGYEELSLTSLSTLDYSSIKELVFGLVEKNKDKMIGVSLPSLRLDSFSIDILKEIQKIRKTGLTFAPEAGTQRLRDVINKGVTEDNLRETMKHIFSLGWNKVKLYFMIGLPTETDEDLIGISDLGNLVTYIHKTTPREERRDGLQVTISASAFVPKPFTPFQFMAQPTIDEFKQKQSVLKKEIINKKIRFTYHDAETSVLEGVFARGDRRLSKVLVKAYELGCKFDGWGEYFDYAKWMEAFEQTGVDPTFYTSRVRSYDEIFPWDFIDIGVTKQFLMSEYEKALKAETTVDCRQGCTGCGVNSGTIGGVCF